ncbi:XRE family transcriptional regulator [bacterium]|nr:XRE family transcriptional regulator [bacterium]
MEELNYIEIGKRIKIKRKELNLTQEKLSEIIDVSPSYISEIERGSSICSLATITNIAHTLNTSLDYLVLGITANNANEIFKEILQSIPAKNQKLYIDLCENIANTLK